MLSAVFFNAEGRGMGLSTEQIAEFKQALEKRRDQLRMEARREQRQVTDREFFESNGEVRDPGDEALAIQMSDFNISTLAKDARELRQTEAALQRIADGTFGWCEDCGGEIPVERLRVAPWARRCTRCQARWEQSRGRQDLSPSL